MGRAFEGSGGPPETTMGHRREPLSVRRHAGAAALAALLALGIALSPATVRPVLALGFLRTAAAATYTLDPGAGRVHVAIDWTVTNLQPDTPTVTYYYNTVRFALPGEARAIRASDSAGALRITTRERRLYVEATVHLRSNLFFRETDRFTVRYDLVGGAPRSDSAIRVGEAFATFGVWAWGDPGLGTVEVRTPKGFGSQVDGSPMELDTGTSGQTLSASPPDPATFYAIVSAENRSAYASNRVSIEGGVEIVVRAWPEDDPWEETVSETLREALPELMDLIGLPWPVERDLDVRERYTPALEGYAGVFFTEEQRIDISEDLDPVIIVHEASHAWFDPDLFTDRWIYEGLAEEYAWRVLRELGSDAAEPAAAPDLDDPGFITLGAWSFPQVIRDQDTDDRERYGYGAAYWVMHAIVEEVGVEAMRAAFAAAKANQTAYPGARSRELVARGDSWRRFLDLVEPIDEPEGDAIEALLRAYVVRDNDARALGERDEARAEYRQLVESAAGWATPWFVRAPMGEWRFDLATARMDDAGGVLALRGMVDEAATGLGLEPDDALRLAYEGTSETFDGARSIGERQLAALAAIGAARARVDAEPNLVTRIGLLGETPRVPYEAARHAFERGDLDAAIVSAGAAASIVAGAAGAGQGRLLIAVVAVLVLVILLVVALVLRRRARRRRAPALAAATQPYATLAADPVPVPAPPGDGPPEVEGGHARGDWSADP